MARDFLTYIMRVILIIGLCWLVGATRCASAQLTKEVTQQQAQNTSAKATASKYIPEGKDLDQVLTALDDSSDLLSRQNRKLTHETARADENQGAADFVFWLNWAGRLAVIGAAAWGALQIGRKIPIVRNWLPGG